ncbi:phosphotransferase family protein [Streptomyces physcomitrii]|uniref:Phosphotransferase family protein n=1 Tax=Streptomyces physcomitrii TaxID=2724184 RepID=A0ABX1GWV4_9ACTN|nr:phosphotransferase family protein [Streptomyces physcomitrii]NKI40569.1 phosphotransferase family protein [Streptomyces physcomitrii]
MSLFAEHPAPQTAAPRGVDTAALTAWLARELPGAFPEGPRLSLIAGGRSNLTYRLTGGERPMVLRRPPLGHVLSTAHDMSREYRVMSALAGSAVPVPRMRAFCSDLAVLGAQFYVMDEVDGVVHRSATELSALDPAEGRALGLSLADTLATLHTVDPGSVGLAGFGRPEGFMARQVARWRRQLAASRTRRLPGVTQLAERLEAGLPTAPPPALVHGDYRLDNVMFAARGTDRVAAVLDWEMATVGDPLADLGMFCVYWDGLSGLGEAVPPAPGACPGWPDRAELVARYAARTGLPLDALRWYIAFGFFKIAVILEGIHYRYAKGLTVGEGFEGIAAAVPELIRRGHATFDGAH